MKTHCAVIRQAPTKESRRSFEVIEVQLERPRQGELLVKMVASGLCHSDDHLATGGLRVPTYPIIGGHEGAGIVTDVGPHTPQYVPGDHVIFSFLPGCGRCRWCAGGQQNLCDLGANLLGGRPDDPTSYRAHLADGTDVAQMCGLGTFSEHCLVSVDSVLKVAVGLPLEKLCLLGCGVGTGWGSAVNSAEVRPGDTVIVMGIGGIGINAVQGAAHAGASHVITVDPVAFKREAALELGATEAFDDIEGASAFARSQTQGQGADSVIVAVGVTHGEHIAQGFAATRKGGTVVATGLGDLLEIGLPISIAELTLNQKRVQGSLFGQSSPTGDIPRQIDLYRAGRLKLDALVTRTYTLDEVAQGYADMHAGRNIRGVIVFD